MSLWTGAGNAGAFATARKGAGHLAAVECLKDWTRSRFALGDGDTVMVTEVASTLPGFPLVGTVVGFWTDGGLRHHYKVFKPVEDVVAADVPPAWLKEALALSAGIECACC